MNSNSSHLSMFGQSLLILAALLFWCSHALATDNRPDYWPTDEWRSASPESQGMDSEVLLDLLAAAWRHKLGINGLVIIRNGYIVLEVNGFAYDAADKRNIYSCSKSITSALVGIAMDQGYIDSVHQPIKDFFPKQINQKMDIRKHAITLEHLLTMSTGLECRDSYLYDWRGIKQMEMSSDWVQFLLELPLYEEPGTRFEYCNGASFLLSAIVQQQTHMNTLSYAKKNLFTPLGINDYSWPNNPQGITLGYAKLHLRPRDMAKIGYLYLHEGRWDNKQIVSSRWIQESTQKHITANVLSDYGYQWWIVNPNVFTALGHEGQYIIVVPEKNVVAVFTSSLIQKDTWAPMGLLFSHILPAVKSSKPLPENYEALKSLNTFVNTYQTSHDRDPADIPPSLRQPQQKTVFSTYHNKAHNFSVQYDADFISWKEQFQTPVTFKARGLRGLPEFSVLIDDIPQNLDLKDTAKYLMGYYKKMFAKPEVKIKSKYILKLPEILQRTADYLILVYKALFQQTKPNIIQEKLIELADGTLANYLHIDWHAHKFKIATMAVVVYKGEKLICVLAHGLSDTPSEYLNHMATSLRFR